MNSDSDLAGYISPFRSLRQADPSTLQLWLQYFVLRPRRSPSKSSWPVCPSQPPFTYRGFGLPLLGCTKARPPLNPCARGSPLQSDVWSPLHRPSAPRWSREKRPPCLRPASLVQSRQLRAHQISRARGPDHDNGPSTVSASFRDHPPPCLLGLAIICTYDGGARGTNLFFTSEKGYHHRETNRKNIALGGFTKGQ